MATIAKISTGASASSALNYALGKNRSMHEQTERWLHEHGLTRAPEFAHCRAVSAGGTNGIDPFIAVEQFSAVQELYHQTKRQNQVARITQSFALDELDPKHPEDWVRATDLGIAFAEKIYPKHQCAIYTHLDGTHHVLHNHIIVNKVQLETGKKLREPQGKTVERARQINDVLAQEQGWAILPPPVERKSDTEKELREKGAYSYMADLRNRIDKTMNEPLMHSIHVFKRSLERKGVIVSERGQMLSYAFLDANNTQRRVRAARLGTDFDKETIIHELENRKTSRFVPEINPTRKSDRAINRIDSQIRTRKSTLDETASTSDRIEYDIKRRESATQRTQQQLDYRKSMLTRLSQRMAQLRTKLPKIMDAVVSRLNRRKPTPVTPVEKAWTPSRLKRVPKQKKTTKRSSQEIDLDR